MVLFLEKRRKRVISMELSKTKGLIIALIVVVGVFAFFVGQEVLAEDVVVAKVNVDISPLGSPVNAVDVSVDAEAHRARVYKSTLSKGFEVKEAAVDEIAAATVYFSNNMTIKNATGDVIFSRTIVSEESADKVIEVYAPLEDAEPGTALTITIEIEIRIDLPTGDSITRTVEREIVTQVEEG